jgi:hypothetical protein
MRRGSLAGFLAAWIAAPLLAGCIQDAGPTFSYQKNGQPVSADQEAIDKAACDAEGEAGANAARPALQPGEYDLVKNMAAGSHHDNAEDISKRCMSSRGYAIIEGPRKGLFN